MSDNCLSLLAQIANCEITPEVISQALLSNPPHGYFAFSSNEGQVKVYFINCGQQVQLQVHVKEKFYGSLNGWYLTLRSDKDSGIAEARFNDGLVVLNLPEGVYEGHLALTEFSDEEYARALSTIQRQALEGFLIHPAQIRTMLRSTNPEIVSTRPRHPAEPPILAR